MAALLAAVSNALARCPPDSQVVLHKLRAILEAPAPVPRRTLVALTVHLPVLSFLRQYSSEICKQLAPLGGGSLRIECNNPDRIVELIDPDCTDVDYATCVTAFEASVATIVEEQLLLTGVNAQEFKRRSDWKSVAEDNDVLVFVPPGKKAAPVRVGVSAANLAKSLFVFCPSAQNGASAIGIIERAFPGVRVGAMVPVDASKVTAPFGIMHFEPSYKYVISLRVVMCVLQVQHGHVLLRAPPCTTIRIESAFVCPEYGC